MKATIYETITNQIVIAIEEGAGMYKMPWHRVRNDVTSPAPQFQQTSIRRVERDR